MNYYAITIRKCAPVRNLNTLDVAFRVYESYLNFIKKSDEKADVRYHYESVANKSGTFNVHLHAMVRTPNLLFLSQKKGYHLYVHPCKSSKNWLRYITKNQFTKEQIKTLLLTKNNPTIHMLEDFRNIGYNQDPSTELLNDSDIDPDNLDNKIIFPRKNIFLHI